MRIISLNTWGGRVFEPLMQLIPNIEADVYCFQEMFKAPAGVNGFAVDPSHHHPKKHNIARINLFEDIQKALPNHVGYFWPFAHNHINDGTMVDLGLEYGIATFVRETLPIVGTAVGFVHSEYRFLKTGELPLPRNAHAFKIFRPDTQKFLVIAHMHGLWVREGKHDTPERKVQGEKFLQLVEDVDEGGNSATILCGDFNLKPDSEFLRSLTSRAGGYRELVAEGNYKSTRSTFYTKNPEKNPPYFADYMLVNRRVNVNKFKVVYDPEVSDHCPLVLDIE